MLSRMMELLVHHYNLGGAMSREAAAKGLGLDPEPYKHPYPGSTNNVFNLMMPGESKSEAVVKVDDNRPGGGDVKVDVSSGGKGLWRKVLPWVPAAVLGTGLVAGGLAWILSLVLSPPAPPPPSGGAGQPGIVYEVWERDEGGGWKKSELTVEQLLGGKPLP